MKAVLITLTAALNCIVCAGADNLLTDPDMESAKKAWFANGTKKDTPYKEVVQKSQNQPHSGKWCLQITDNWTNANPYAVQVIRWKGVKPVLKFHARAEKTQVFRAGFFFRKNGKQIASSLWRFSAGTEWKEFSYEPKEIPADFDELVVAFLPSAKGAAAETGRIFIDDTELTAAQ